MQMLLHSVFYFLAVKSYVYGQAAVYLNNGCAHLYQTAFLSSVSDQLIPVKLTLEYCPEQ